MQCKDIPDKPILEFLATQPGHWFGWWNGREDNVRKAMPLGLDTPDNLVLAKMRSLIKRELVEGCTCDCRGDFYITPKGCEAISRSDLIEKIPE
jgi:hypothetical protein